MNKSWFPGGHATPLLCPHRSFRKQFVRHRCRLYRQDAGRTLMVTGPPSVTDRRPPDGRTSAAVLSSYPTCSLPPTTREDLPVRLPTGELSAPAPMCNRTLGTSRTQDGRSIGERTRPRAAAAVGTPVVGRVESGSRRFLGADNCVCINVSTNHFAVVSSWCTNSRAAG